MHSVSLFVELGYGVSLECMSRRPYTKISVCKKSGVGRGIVVWVPSPRAGVGMFSLHIHTETGVRIPSIRSQRAHACHLQSTITKYVQIVVAALCNHRLVKTPPNRPLLKTAEVPSTLLLLSRTSPCAGTGLRKIDERTSTAQLLALRD